DDLAQANLLGGAREREAAGAAPDGAEIAEVLQLVDDLDDVVTRDAEVVGHLGGGRALVRSRGRMDQHAEGVVREHVKLHLKCNFTAVRAPIQGSRPRSGGERAAGATAFGGARMALR